MKNEENEYHRRQQEMKDNTQLVIEMLEELDNTKKI